MKIKVMAIATSCLFSQLLVQPAIAENVSVITTWEVKEVVGDRVTGNITADVINMTGSSIKNVDLRLADPGRMSVERGVLQLGQIPHDDIATTTKGFYAEQGAMDSGEPILWRLDYDDANGGHQQEIIFSGQNQ